MFVDWLNVSQHHGAAARELVGEIRIVFGEDGEPKRESAGSVAIRGSYDTALQIRSHGGWVHVSGNPSRFSRPDNLFGLDLDDCMEVVNEQLARLDLPCFTRGERMPFRDEDIKAGRLGAWTGAAFARLDVTENYRTGSDFLARLAVRAYARMSKKRTRRHTFGDETAMWVTQRCTVKAYRKGPDMAVHCKASPWIDWATTQGIVRHEVELRSKLLSDTGLRYWGNLDMGTLRELHGRHTAFLSRADASLDPCAVEHVPNRARLAYAAWLKGENVRELMSRATFYRARRVLLDAASVDIAEQREAGQVVPIVRTVELQVAREPLGYWDRRAA